jgi:glycosyltransferase involved in cell wall biosynthesis
VPAFVKNFSADPVARYLSSKGHEVTVICPEPDHLVDTGERYAKINFEYVSKYVRVDSPKDLFFRLGQMTSLHLKMRQLLTREDFDIVRTVSLIPSYVGVKLKKGDTPLVANLSDFFSDLYKQSGLPATDVVCSILRSAERKVVSGCDALIVDSPYQRRLWKHWGLDERQSVVLPHGYDPERFGPSQPEARIREKYSIGPDEPVLFYHGDISEEDGVDILVRAVKILRSRGIVTRLLIVGTGTRAYMDKLRNVVKNEGISDSVILAGWIPHAWVSAYIAIADVCVIPCRCALTSASNFSNKLIEYIAMTKRIVMSNVLGTKEMLGNLITFVRPGDPDALAQGVMNALYDQDSSSLLLKVKKRLEWSKIVEHEERILIAAKDGVEDLRFLDYSLL